MCVGVSKISRRAARTKMSDVADIRKANCNVPLNETDKESGYFVPISDGEFGKFTATDGAISHMKHLKLVLTQFPTPLVLHFPRGRLFQNISGHGH